MKHIKSLRQIATASALGSVLALGLAGCDSGKNDAQSIQKRGVTVFIEKDGDGYKVADEFPSNETRVFLREKNPDGNVSERLLSQAEIDELTREAGAKIDAGTSALNGSQISSGGLGLGEAILASAAGAIIGSWIGSKLFNSPGYQNARQSAYKNPSAYSRSVNNFSKSGASAGSGAKKSGFFGGGASKSANSGSFGG